MEERINEERRVSFLDSKISMMSKKQFRRGMERLASITKRASFQVSKRVDQGNIQLSTRDPISFDVHVLCSSEMRGRDGRVFSGICWPEANVIGLLNHLMLAPSEVVFSIATHEILHLIYPRVIRDSSEELKIRFDILEGYAEEVHGEEEWVRCTNEELCGREDLIENWEVSVEEFGDRWETCYERLKKHFNSDK